MTSESTSRPTLATLPYELIMQIISNRHFDRGDLKNFRILCRSFEQPAASLLFSEVMVSRLRVDRDAFERIAAQPHLAKHVRQIVWQELNLEAWRHFDEGIAQEYDQWYLDKFGDFEGADGMGLVPINQLMLQAVNDPALFWWPRISREPISLANCQRIISSFLSQFTAAVDRMPKLTAFRTCPMPARRVFFYKGYPLQADLYRFRGNQYLPRGAEGFSSFMLPVMSRVESKIVSLYWADEAIWTNLTSNIKPEDSQAFSKLTSIDLCIGDIFENTKVIIPTLVACLNAATKLECLSLCLERLEADSQRLLSDAIFSGCYWPCLHSFRLMNTDLGKRTRKFIQFCIKHSKSLRHITFDASRVLLEYPCDLNGSDMKLESVTIAGPNMDDSNLDIDDVVLALINKPMAIETPAGPKMDYDDRGSYAEILPSTYDYHAWCMSGFYNSDIAHCEYTCDEGEAMEICSEDSEYEQDGEHEDEGEFKDSQPNTYWAWDRFGPNINDVYYWEVDEEHALAQTTHWQFTNRDGITALGKDPLDFFSDWDSDEGDVAAPTPFGPAFWEFRHSNVVLSLPPQGATRYNPAQDPLGGLYDD